MNDSLSEYHILVDALAGELPSIPLIMNDLLKIVSDSNAALFGVRDIIKKDKAIFSKVLKSANSFEIRQGSDERIILISDAIQRLGFERIKKIVLNTSVFTLFEELKGNSQFKLQDLWMHSCGVAIATECLAKRYESKYFEHAYSCGLLHDLGKVAKVKYHQESFFKEINHALETNSCLFSTELNLNSLRHDILGAMIIQKWGISPIVEQTTRWHHTAKKTERIEVNDQEIHKLIDLVKLANQIVKDLQFGNSGYNALTELSPEVFKRRKIEKEEFNECKEIVQSAFDNEAENLTLFFK